jgi:formylmethanofuran dehydrogenase subunit C
VTLTLELRSVPPGRVDASPLTLPGDDIAARTLRCGRERLQVGDLFAVSGSNDGSVRLAGDLRRFDWVARGLEDGEVVVDGDAGAWAGAELRGGRLTIHGSAGDRLGGAAPGARSGMSGGEIVVTGDAGDEAGAGMRRGLVAIGGRAGAGAGLRMLAGTVIAFGGLGAEAGMGNRRGSLVSAAPVTPLPGYAFATRVRPPALALQLRRVRALGLRVDDVLLGGRWARWSGDRLELARGELLIFDEEEGP